MSAPEDRPPGSGGRVASARARPDDGVRRAPAWTSAIVSVFAAILAVGIVGARLEAALYVGAAGVVLVSYGAVVGVRRRVGEGTVVVLLAVTLAGAAGVGPVAMLAATLCALLAWDAGQYGITVGEQLGRVADTKRAELVHATLTTAVGVIGGLLGYGAYLVATGDQPTLAVVLLFAGAAALVLAVRSG